MLGLNFYFCKAWEQLWVPWQVFCNLWIPPWSSFPLALVNLTLDLKTSFWRQHPYICYSLVSLLVFLTIICSFCPLFYPNWPYSSADRDPPTCFWSYSRLFSSFFLEYFVSSISPVISDSLSPLGHNHLRIAFYFP